MRLRHMAVRNFRSIESADLENCGDLNVFIGKNNSGKSNALLAIDRFFRFIGKGSLATHEPPVTESADWFHADYEREVRFVATLHLSEQEESRLREKIAEEAPQMRNALDEIPRTGLIGCEVSFHKSEAVLGYVSDIYFFSADSAGAAERSICRMGQAAAHEIASRNSRLNAIRSQALALQEFIETFDGDDYRVAKDRGINRVLMMRSRPRDALMRDPVLPELQRDLSESATYSEFESAARNRIELLESEARLLPTVQNQNRVDTFSGSANAIPRYIEDFIQMVGDLKVHRMTEDRAPIGQSEARKVLHLKMSRGLDQKLRDLQHTVQSLLGVRIDAFSGEDLDAGSRYEALRRRNYPRAELDVDDFLVEVNGSGIRQSLRLMLDYEFEDPNVLLIEEPEVYLHPALEVAILQYLKSISGSCQIFLTTHSTNFLDTAEFKNVYLVTRDGSTTIQVLNMEDAEEAVPEELGIRLSSLFMYDRLIFVEGLSDEQILRELARTLEINLAQHSVGFITTGGSRNFTHYATASTLGFLTKRRVSLTFVLDKDERTAEEDEQLARQVDGLGSVHVLRRRELENYLLSPVGICRFIEWRNGPDSGPDRQEVEAAIIEEADTLKAEAIGRRIITKALAPVRPYRKTLNFERDDELLRSVRTELGRVRDLIDARDSELPADISAAVREVETNWTEHKLALAPGDELVSRVLKRYGISYRKTRDAAALARCIPAQDIDRELRDLLQEVAES